MHDVLAAMAAVALGLTAGDILAADRVPSVVVPAGAAPYFRAQLARDLAARSGCGPARAVVRADAALRRAPSVGPLTAVVVPYRPHPRQRREQHLQRFMHTMTTEVLPGLGTALGAWRVYVVQQSEDGRKFNRGALLNAGARMAMDDGFTTLILHDVDLVPMDPALRAQYAQDAGRAPLHLASAWDKYTYPSYLGGVLTLSRGMLRACNGFPNTMWGWGGEDDALAGRLHRAGLPCPVKLPRAPGAYLDLEDVYPGEVRACTTLREGGDESMRNMLRTEGKEADASRWQTDGLHQTTWTTERVLQDTVECVHLVVRLA
jgi:hypothetical protein